MAQPLYGDADAFANPDAFVDPDAFVTIDAFSEPGAFVEIDALAKIDAFVEPDAFVKIDVQPESLSRPDQTKTLSMWLSSQKLWARWAPHPLLQTHLASLSASG